MDRQNMTTVVRMRVYKECLQRSLFLIDALRPIPCFTYCACDVAGLLLQVPNWVISKS